MKVRSYVYAGVLMYMFCVVITGVVLGVVGPPTVGAARPATPWYGSPPRPGVIIRGPTAPPGLSPEIEAEIRAMKERISGKQLKKID